MANLVNLEGVGKTLRRVDSMVPRITRRARALDKEY